MALFGDVTFVITTEELRQQFCALPHAAVLAWLKAANLKVPTEGCIMFQPAVLYLLCTSISVSLLTVPVLALYLQVHSESCVLFLLSAWVNNKERPACSAQQMEQLVHNVRVEHLSSAYLYFVLPDLEWFSTLSTNQSKYDIVSSLRVIQFNRAKPRSKCIPWGGPPVWSASKRTRSRLPALATITLELGPTDLQRLEAAASGVSFFLLAPHLVVAWRRVIRRVHNESFESLDGYRCEGCPSVFN